MKKYSKKEVRNTQKQRTIRSIKYFEEKELYKVIKPWGNEIWINGQKPTYSIKKISIKKGYRTSLQFHKKKVETNFLQKGKAKLYYSTKSGKYSKNIILNNTIL